MRNDYEVIEAPTAATSTDGPMFGGPQFEPGVYTGLFERFFGSGLEGFVGTLLSWWQGFAFFSLVFSAVLLYGIIYSKIRYSQLMGELMVQLKAEEVEWQRMQEESPDHVRWRQAREHALSENPNDWRLAIIEADIMLEEVLDQAGFVGRTIGDRLKTANRDTFRSLDDAWEAHKIRNEIAHSGGDFVLTKRMTNEAMARFENVFRELGAL